MIEGAVNALLCADAAVAALVGARVYSGNGPQEATLPAVVITRISTTRELAHSGPSGLAEARLQVSCYARTYDQAKDLAAKVVACLDGYSGTVGGEKIQRAEVVNELDFYDADLDEHHVPVDVMVTF